MLFPPIGMFSSNPFFGEFPGEQAHLKREQDALFSRHGPQNLHLDSLRRRTGIGEGHRNMLAKANSEPAWPRFPSMDMHQIKTAFLKPEIGVKNPI